MLSSTASSAPAETGSEAPAATEAPAAEETTEAPAAEAGSTAEAASAEEETPKAESIECDPLTIDFSTVYNETETGGQIIKHFEEYISNLTGGAITF